jgi:hypothetical protein
MSSTGEPPEHVPPADAGEQEEQQPAAEAADALAELERLDVDLSVPSAPTADDEERGDDFDFEWPEQVVEEITLEGTPLGSDEEQEEFPRQPPAEDATDADTADAMHVEHGRAQRVEPTSQAEPEPGSESEPEPGSESEPEPGSESEPEPGSESEPETTISRAWTQTEHESSTAARDSKEQVSAAGESPALGDDEYLPGRDAGARQDRTAASSDDMPAVLREALAEAERTPPGGVVTAAALALSALLLIVLLAQLAFYNRSNLIQRYPALTPFAQQVCAQFGCDIELPRDVSRVVVVSRDVRSHPSVSGALLITATINNEAAFAQPCPEVELSLFDLTGTLVAQRRFSPEEYLDDAPQPGTVSMMQPNKPVRLRLEVRDPGQHAINYEFTFL